MTMISVFEQKCSVCGETMKSLFSATVHILPEFSMDLDTRPPREARDAMSMWVHECKQCGYVARQVSDTLPITIDYLNTNEYKSCNGLSFKSDLAEKFYKFYLINKHIGDYKEAFDASLHAAWASDDASDIDNAILCRNQCLELINTISGKIDRITSTIMTADLLRRTRQFDKVIEKYQDYKIGDGFDCIIKFEVERALERDDKCYTLNDTDYPDKSLLSYASVVAKKLPTSTTSSSIFTPKFDLFSSYTTPTGFICLRDVKHPQKTVSYSFEKEIWVGEKGDIREPHDKIISKKHCIIERSFGSCYMSDKNSTKRIKLNGNVVSSPKLLHEGDIITIGRDSFVVTFRQPEIQVPLVRRK